MVGVPRVGSGVPAQPEGWQVSLTVQGFPSSQGWELGVWVQLPEASHASVVQGLPSSQFSGTPWQLPLAHASPVVQGFPSLQGWELATCTQVPEVEQPSSVQEFPSSQFRRAPLTQAPPEQVSPTVQGFPSLQGSALLTWPATTPGSAPQTRGSSSRAASRFSGGGSLVPNSRR
jgi:hypothetical protein